MKFNKISITTGLILLSVLGIQAAPPSVIVLPDDQWCIENGYFTVVNKRGKERKVPDLTKAFQENRELVNVVPAINDLLAQSGLKAINFAAQNESDDEEDAIEEFYEGAESGAGLETNSLDYILNKFKPDITLRLGWNVNQYGFDYNCSYRLSATDAYSNKEIATVTSETATTKRSVPLAATLKNAAQEQMSDFVGKMTEHKEDLETNGREIRLRIGIIGNGAGTNMNSEFSGKTLRSIIYDWVMDNTVNHQATEASASRNRVRYTGVRIPLRDSNQRPMQATQFVEQLQKYLQATYGIRSENVSSGLGSGRLMIGEK